MIFGVDIGGTKTLIAQFDESGNITKEVRLKTNPDYSAFLDELKTEASKFTVEENDIVCVAVPGLINREQGTLHSLGNLPWKDVPIRDDIGKSLGAKNIYIENDSKLAGLGEVMALPTLPARAYYITISTGIGGTLLLNGKIAQEVIDGEIGMVPMYHDNKLVKWESFASGKAFFEKYRQKAADTNDPKIWEEFSHNIGLGIAMVCCIYQIETIIFGGGLGQHVDKFKDYLTPYVTTHLHSTITRPKQLVGARYGDESVIYGCYEYAKHHSATPKSFI